MKPAFIQAALDWLTQSASPEAVAETLKMRASELNLRLAQIGSNKKLEIKPADKCLEVFVLRDGVEDSAPIISTKPDASGKRFDVFLHRDAAALLLEPNDPRHYGAYRKDISSSNIAHEVSVLFTIVLSDEEKQALFPVTGGRQLPARGLA